MNSNSTDRSGVEFSNRCPLLPFQVILMNSYLPMEEKERSYPEEPNIEMSPNCNNFQCCL